MSSTGGKKLGGNRWLLEERLKELRCLYEIAGIYNRPGVPLRRVLRESCSAIKAAWQHPSKTAVRFLVPGVEVRSAGWRDGSLKLHCLLRLGGRRAGSIEVCYTGPPVEPQGSAFLPPERRLLQAIGELTENMLLRREAEEKLGNSAERLRAQKRLLERKNIALREVLSQIERQKDEVRRRVIADLETLLLPALRRMKDAGASPEGRQRSVAAVERGLLALRSARARGAPSVRSLLSSRELEIGDLVRGGATSKEIAGMLHITEPTVERHRHNIRRKLGISHDRTNLASYLSEAL